MARPLRNDFAGALHHLTSRGNNKGDIFLDDDDRLRFLALLAATVIRFGWRLYAWVLMNNHFHLEVETPEANLSRGMHWLNTRYVGWFFSSSWATRTTSIASARSASETRRIDLVHPSFRGAPRQASETPSSAFGTFSPAAAGEKVPLGSDPQYEVFGAIWGHFGAIGVRPAI